MGYEGIQILVEALERSQKWESGSIREALASSQPIHTLTGQVSMDARRNILRPAVILMIQADGHLKYQATLPST